MIAKTKLLPYVFGKLYSALWANTADKGIKRQFKHFDNEKVQIVKHQSRCFPFKMQAHRLIFQPNSYISYEIPTQYQQKKPIVFQSAGCSKIFTILITEFSRDKNPFLTPQDNVSKNTFRELKRYPGNTFFKKENPHGKNHALQGPPSEALRLCNAWMQYTILELRGPTAPLF